MQGNIARIAVNIPLRNYFQEQFYDEDRLKYFHGRPENQYSKAV